MNFIPLTYTDRSRIATGWSWCPRKRFLEYHSGPWGYGIRPTSQAVPLVTGLEVHEGLRKILQRFMSSGWPDRNWLRSEVIISGVESYLKVCEQKGLLHETTSQTQIIIKEQCSLVEGLLWGAYHTALPQVLQEFEPVMVEEEQEFVIYCTCGLGAPSGMIETHVQRECNGVICMTRGDLIMKRRADGQLCNLDFKTAGNVNDYNWGDALANSLQFALTNAAIKVLHGIEIKANYILGLHKGWRKSEREQDEVTGEWQTTDASAQIRRQDSLFCWAWRRPGNPPMEPEDWKAGWKYTEWDEKKGKLAGRTLQGKGYEKAPLWEAEFINKPPDWTRVEFWVERLLQDERDIERVARQFKLAGPYAISEERTEATLRAVAAEERRWLDARWAIYEAVQAAGGDVSASEAQAVLDEHVPQSWDCHRFNRQCEFSPICNQDQGWEDPLAGGKYEPRAPHHAGELAQALARGAQTPAGQEVGE